MQLVDADMQRVNRMILDMAAANAEMIPEIARHLIDSGGKRLRPMLTLAAALACGYQGDGHVKLAATVEDAFSQCALARADLQQAIACLGIDGAQDAVNNACIVQEVLTKALTRLVLVLLVHIRVSAIW